MSKSLQQNGETVFLTGATGYVGSVVAEKLIAAGYAVRGLIRKEEQAEQLRKAGSEPFVGDVLDAARVAKGAEGAAAIVHTAAPGNPSAAGDMQQMINDTADIISTVVQTAKANVARAIITSGVSLYGHAAGQIFDEGSTMSPPFPGAERIADLEADLAKNGEALFLRLGIVFGRTKGGLIPGFIDTIRERGRTALVDPNNRLSIVNVDDAADLYLAMLEHDTPPPILNAVSDIIGWPEVIALVAKATGVPNAPDMVNPQEAMMLGGPAVYMPMDMAVSGNLAREALGWRPSAPTFEGALPQVPAVALIRGKITGPDYQRGLPAWADLYVTSDRATLLRALRAQTIADRLGRPLDPEYQDTIDDALDIPAVATAKTLQEQATPSVQAVFATWLQGGE